MKGLNEAKRIWLSVLGAGDSTSRGERLCRARGLSRKVTFIGKAAATSIQYQAIKEVKTDRKILSA